MQFIKSLFLACIVLTATTTISYSQTDANNQTSDGTKTVTVKVKGVTCAMDLKMISANVEKLKGVSSCKTVKKGATTTFDVSFDPSLVSEKEINAAIENTGSCEDPNERPYKVKQ